MNDAEIDDFVSAIDDESLHQIADALAIPETTPWDSCNLQTAILWLRYMVRHILEAHGSDTWRDKINTSGTRQAAGALAKAIRSDERIAHHWPTWQTGPDELLRILDWLAKTSNTGQRLGASPRTRKANRRIEMIVGAVVRFAHNYGGCASLDKDQMSGRLVDALSLLRELLPPNMIPRHLSPTIARYKRAMAAHEESFFNLQIERWNRSKSALKSTLH